MVSSPKSPTFFLKVLIFSVSIFLLFPNLGYPQMRSDREADGFIGSVRKVIMKINELKPASPSPKLIKYVKIATYNVDGNRLRFESETHVNGKLETWTKVLSTYDSRKQKKYETSETMANGKPFGKKRETTFSHTYNKDGKLKESIAFNKDQSVDHKIIYTYNENGTKVERIRCPTKDFCLGRRVEEYDENKTLRNRTVYHSDGYKVSVSIYDDKGLQVEFLKLDPKGNLIRKSIPSYDSNGNQIGNIDYDSQGVKIEREPALVEYKYDSKGNWIQKKTTYLVEGNIVKERILTQEFEYFEE